MATAQPEKSFATIERMAGFAPANDVGAQDFRDTDAGSMLRVKGEDGFNEQ